ncbi:type 1 glutamine amidotransferase [Umezawaea endophytica]|uniref:Type 1 glutamine amidotransferase n=1 Tax=Umezawaea endophytica TaxID=1654476 RepID=A0A9X2VI55_9PSEU|nr:type 1 glutamine amidotransferase [Umezawaea endophytica]MCS7476952.1 type 1 glutamine amidotransferase [Umezawaea endophytica]
MADHREVVLVLRHQVDAGPGNLGAWLTANGLPWEVVDVSTGVLPTPRRHRALVVLGSREAAYDDGVPWLAAEREFVRASIALGTPVLGICFGAQLLARLLGGDVRRAATVERGWIPVQASGGEYADVLGGTWFEWHGDEITAPATATVLAGGTCVQAFREGPHLGVQFHPEVTSDQLVRWMDSDRRLRLLEEVGGERATLLADTAAHLPDAAEAAGRLYARFFGTG